MNDERRSPAALRERAEKCRRLARGISDTTAKEQLARFAEELETQARLLDENVRAVHTHREITRQALAELKHTSAQAKEAARRVKEGLKNPAGEDDPEG
jgi:methyl-accepting chemotaxis protein